MFMEEDENQSNTFTPRIAHGIDTTNRKEAPMKKNKEQFKPAACPMAYDHRASHASGFFIG